MRQFTSPCAGLLNSLSARGGDGEGGGGLGDGGGDGDGEGDEGGGEGDEGKGEPFFSCLPSQT